MSRVACTFWQFIEIIEAHGFVVTRTESSHRRYRLERDGQVWNVTVAFHNINHEIKPDTLASMIRQSGLPRNLFRR